MKADTNKKCDFISSLRLNFSHLSVTYITSIPRLGGGQISLVLKQYWWAATTYAESKQALIIRWMQTGPAETLNGSAAISQIPVTFNPLDVGAAADRKFVQVIAF